MATAEEAAVELPEEITTDILGRLPVKSLVRFRCVCKSWRSMINNPYFIRKHLTYTTNAYNNNMVNAYESAVLYNQPTTKIDTTTTPFKFLEIYKEEEEEEGGNCQKITSSVIELECPPELSSSLCSIEASCDGILCIITRDSIFLWNPSIKVYKKLPPSPSKFRCDDGFGIGYDPIVDDYKVLRAPTHVNPMMTNSPHSSVEVLALKKSNSWKTVVLDEFPYKTIYSHSPTFTDGGFHWVAVRSGIREATMILYFDVVGETFGEVPLPPLGSSSTTSCGLLLLRGKLCVVQHKHESLFELWVMMEYGVRESWIKFMTVPKFPQSLYRTGTIWATPFCLTRTGVVISIKGKGEFSMYTTKDENFEKIFIDGLGIIYQKISYVESLVSPV